MQSPQQQSPSSWRAEATTAFGSIREHVAKGEVYLAETQDPTVVAQRLQDIERTAAQSRARLQSQQQGSSSSGFGTSS